MERKFKIGDKVVFKGSKPKVVATVVGFGTLSDSNGVWKHTVTVSEKYHNSNIVRSITFEDNLRLFRPKTTTTRLKNEVVDLKKQLRKLKEDLVGDPIETACRISTELAMESITDSLRYSMFGVTGKPLTMVELSEHLKKFDKK